MTARETLAFEVQMLEPSADAPFIAYPFLAEVLLQLFFFSPDKKID